MHWITSKRRLTSVTFPAILHPSSITANRSSMLRLPRNWLSTCSRFMTRISCIVSVRSGGASSDGLSHNRLRRFANISATRLAFISRSSVSQFCVNQASALSESTRFLHSRLLLSRFGRANVPRLPAIHLRWWADDVLLLFLRRLVGRVPRDVEAKVLKERIQLGHSRSSQPWNASSGLLWNAGEGSRHWQNDSAVPSL